MKQAEKLKMEPIPQRPIPQRPIPQRPMPQRPIPQRPMPQRPAQRPNSRAFTVSLGFALISTAWMVGCGADTKGDDMSGAFLSAALSGATTATITFASDWSETVSGRLIAGQKLRVAYDEARLPRCRAWHNGNPGWQITAFARYYPSAITDERPLFDYGMTSTGPDYHTWIKGMPEFELPPGTEKVVLWFYNRSAFDRPCEDWDSDYGRNYTFSVAYDVALATMDFQSDWRNVLDGNVARGGILTVKYAPERLRTIARSATIGGVPYFAAKYHCYGYGCCSFEYEDTAHVRFHRGGAFLSLALGDGDAGVPVDVPADAEQVELYFDTSVTTTTWYCGGAEGEHYVQPTRDVFYDSNFGRNFRYTIP
ncbi:MAG: hypothetical protein IPK13_15290 [Deltaproteobacteria bacterium]|nr:hypothetical protein [Deltaproteobacteria bacterium]